MSQASERRKKPRRRTIRETEAVWVRVDNGRGASTDLRAKVVDFSETGIRIEMSGALETNTLVVLEGDAGDAFPKGKVSARVVQCTPRSGGGYSLGLTYAEGPGEAKAVEPVTDHYEALQVSPKADPETIHRVYRLQAQRFHPDNGETGDAKIFRAITEAYKILSDPEKRAAYDVHLESYRKFRWRIFDQSEAATGKVAERSKRRGILELLYTARRNQPAQPAVSLHELEDLLGCPREHLEFSLWYLKENALISRSDNGRYSITAKGIDHAEAEEAARMPNKRLLAAGD